MATKTKTRSVETEIRIDASPDQVWNALTDPEELRRWFPLEATAKPGVGGEIVTKWDDEMQGSQRILDWEPGRRLRTTWFEPTEEAAFDGPDRSALVVDYRLEGDRGATLLRLVHSGFGHGEDWDEEYDGVSWGWAFELRSLRHYLQHHLGKDRRVAWARVPTGEHSVEAVVERLWSPQGLLKEGSKPGGREGDRYAFTTASGDRLEGVQHYGGPSGHFAGTVENMDQGLFRSMVEKCGREREAALWLSSWTMPQSQIDELQGRWEGLLRGLIAV